MQVSTSVTISSTKRHSRTWVCSRKSAKAKGEVDKCEMFLEFTYSFPLCHRGKCFVKLLKRKVFSIGGSATPPALCLLQQEITDCQLVEKRL